MALINTLRNKMGKFIVAAVAIAIMSFVLADLLGPNSTLLGGGNNVGEIAGETITLKEFQASVQERESNYILNFNRQPTENERPTLRQQAWDFLITQYAFDKQYEAVGTQVTDDEVWDMLQGKNINPGLQQAFTNPETGEYDRDRFMQYMRELPNLDPNARIRWELFKEELIEGRKRLKYENLLTRTNYITNAEAARQYNAENDVAEIKYLYVPYYAISDSAVSVSESEAKDYFNETKEQYKVDYTRSLSYVAFDIIPSQDDTLFIKDELNQLKESFRNAQNDSSFAELNSDPIGTAFTKYHPGTLPVQLKANIANLSAGDVRGPYLASDGFKLYKITNIVEDTIGYAKASHILFKGEDDETRNKAREVLNELKNGADFAQMAREHGTDGTATRGGNLGWFESGKMVDEFEDAVFKATSTGLLNDVVKTQFGYHIIRVDEVKTNTSYQVATVSREILPSDETINEAYTKADIFSAAVDDIESFNAQAKADSLTIIPVNKLKPNDRRAGVLGDARQVVQWLFADASVNTVSDIFDINDQYIVAVMTGKTEEGYQDFENVQVAIESKLLKEKKGEQIKAKLAGLTGSLDEKAEAYGDDANVYTNSNLLFSTNSLQSVGFDPAAVGLAFSLESGEVSEPYLAENGVLIIEMQNKTTAPEIADYATYKTQLQQQINGQVSFGINEAIKEDADITDERYRFY